MSRKVVVARQTWSVPILLPPDAHIPLRGYVIYRADLEAWLHPSPEISRRAWCFTDTHPDGVEVDMVERLLRHDVKRFELVGVTVRFVGRWGHSRCIAYVETRDVFHVQALTAALTPRRNPLFKPYECRISSASKEIPNSPVKDIGQKVVVGVLVTLMVAALVAIGGWMF